MTDTPDTTWLATAKQCAPVPSTAAEVRTDHPILGDDLEARARMGAEQYGMRLHCRNGRDALVDAYQEALDLVMYMRQAMMERRVSTWHCTLAELVAVAIRDQVAREHGERREDWERLYTEDT